jgi:hypothetical protein
VEILGVAPMEDGVDVLEAVDDGLGVAKEVGQGGVRGSAHGRNLL